MLLFLNGLMCRFSLTHMVGRLIFGLIVNLLPYFVCFYHTIQMHSIISVSAASYESLDGGGLVLTIR